MSYCGPEGVSDFNFTLALDYRDAIAAPALAPAAGRGSENPVAMGIHP